MELNHLSRVHCLYVFMLLLLHIATLSDERAV